MHIFSPDPYEVLGIARDATQREVKQAYRSLAKRFHPDHNPENPDFEVRFKQIQQAYETLTSRRNESGISPPNFYHRSPPPSYFKNEHPFFSFFGALKTYSARIKKDKNSLDRSNLDGANDATE